MDDAVGGAADVRGEDRVEVARGAFVIEDRDERVGHAQRDADAVEEEHDQRTIALIHRVVVHRHDESLVRLPVAEDERSGAHRVVEVRERTPVERDVIDPHHAGETIRARDGDDRVGLVFTHKINRGREADDARTEVGFEDRHRHHIRGREARAAQQVRQVHRECRVPLDRGIPQNLDVHRRGALRVREKNVGRNVHVVHARHRGARHGNHVHRQVALRAADAVDAEREDRVALDDRRGTHGEDEIAERRDVVVDDRDARGGLAAEQRAAGGRAGERHVERFVRLGDGVENDRDDDQLVGLAVRERQRAAGAHVILTRARTAVAGGIAHRDATGRAVGAQHTDDDVRSRLIDRVGGRGKIQGARLEVGIDDCQRRRRQPERDIAGRLRLRVEQREQDALVALDQTVGEDRHEEVRARLAAREIERARHRDVIRARRRGQIRGRVIDTHGASGAAGAVHRHHGGSTDDIFVHAEIRRRKSEHAVIVQNRQRHARLNPRHAPGDGAAERREIAAENQLAVREQHRRLHRSVRAGAGNKDRIKCSVGTEPRQARAVRHTAVHGIKRPGEHDVPRGIDQHRVHRPTRHPRAKIRGERRVGNSVRVQPHHAGLRRAIEIRKGTAEQNGSIIRRRTRVHHDAAHAQVRAQPAGIERGIGRTVRREQAGNAADREGIDGGEIADDEDQAVVGRRAAINRNRAHRVVRNGIEGDVRRAIRAQARHAGVRHAVDLTEAAGDQDQAVALNRQRLDRTAGNPRIQADKCRGIDRAIRQQPRHPGAGDAVNRGERTGDDDRPGVGSGRVVNCHGIHGTIRARADGESRINRTIRIQTRDAVDVRAVHRGEIADDDHLAAGQRSHAAHRVVHARAAHVEGRVECPDVIVVQRRAAAGIEELQIHRAIQPR